MTTIVCARITTNWEIVIYIFIETYFATMSFYIPIQVNVLICKHSRVLPLYL